jgi:hypothetical protein
MMNFMELNIPLGYELSVRKYNNGRFTAQEECLIVKLRKLDSGKYVEYLVTEEIARHAVSPRSLVKEIVQGMYDKLP